MTLGIIEERFCVNGLMISGTLNSDFTLFPYETFVCVFDVGGEKKRVVGLGLEMVEEIEEEEEKSSRQNWDVALTKRKSRVVFT